MSESMEETKEVEPVIAIRVGPEIPADVNPKEWAPTGPADAAEGVFFLGALEQVLPDSSRQTVIPSLERQALRYLRPVNAEWKKYHPGRRGFCKPDLAKLVPAELLAQAEAQNRPIYWLFLSDKHENIHANQPENLRRWRVVRAEDAIWPVYFV